jgi:hypothetical protein
MHALACSLGRRSHVTSCMHVLPDVIHMHISQPQHVCTSFSAAVLLTALLPQLPHHRTSLQAVSCQHLNRLHSVAAVVAVFAFP